MSPDDLGNVLRSRNGDALCDVLRLFRAEGRSGRRVVEQSVRWIGTSRAVGGIVEIEHGELQSGEEGSIVAHDSAFNLSHLEQQSHKSVQELDEIVTGQVDWSSSVQSRS